MIILNTIKELRRKKNLSQQELAALCGVHQTAVSQWENGRTAPDTSTLAIIAQVLGVSVDRILGREEAGKKLIPVLGYVRAGVPMEAVEEILDYEEISAETAASGDFFALQIKGDSMSPRMLPGDVVIVRRQDDVENGEIAVVLCNGDCATVKKVIKKDTSLLLVSLNPEYEPLIYTAEQIRNLPVTILGKVVELRGKF